MTRTKWNGKDWREFICNQCGYWIGKHEYSQSRGCCKYPTARKNDPACPDFEPRDIPDPNFPTSAPISNTSNRRIDNELNNTRSATECRN